ncbi:DUF2793 domain-containing protein [Qipengyuania zhejiangensis]|uniref:DUF2793 domain-containing protein n=1 Tax=Qipengyuania zhejiangensis TaxID=3077782 RepID=UPI002D7804DC|nr:DUF2793 domain-containing protein [Qipengyuania sp. Z2]
MSEPIEFTDTTPRHGLPYLIAGQVQKELFVNESLARIDALLHPVATAVTSSPPPAPGPGKCWIVAPGASGDWTGKDDSLAFWDGAQWTFISPHAGMSVYVADRSSLALYDGAWHQAQTPPLPQGGTTIDAQARTAIQAIVAAMKSVGIISEN